MTKPTLLLATAAGLLAAIVAAGWLPAHPAAAAVVAYMAVVGTLAHGVGAPVLRTIGASVVVVATCLILALRALRALTDVALWLLTLSTRGALHTAKALA
jgi:hypothetical protein